MSQVSTGTRLLLIGLDGASFPVINPFLADGDLPTLSSLVANGQAGTLRSTLPPFTLPAWSSFLTGVSPGRHGIFGFTTRKPNSYGVTFINATYRLTPTFWEILSNQGLRVCSLLFPTTYPPAPVNGVMVSGFDAPITTQVARSFYYPPSIYRELTNAVGRLQIAAVQETKIGKHWHHRAAAGFLSTIKTKTEAAHYLLRKQRWDCFGILFGEADTACHHFWAFHDPNSPRFVPDPADYAQVIRNVYRYLDNAIATLLEHLDPDGMVMIASDHGFGGSGTGMLYLNRWLEQQGWLSFTPQPTGNFVRWGRKIGPRLVPVRLQEQLFRWRQGYFANLIESRAKSGRIDWPRTSAFSLEENYLPGIWLNVRGREPYGIVEPGEPYERYRTLIADQLMTWTAPDHGQRLLNNVYRREDLYSGPGVTRAPDLILEPVLENNYAYTLLESLGPGAAFQRLLPTEALGAKGQGMNGSHRREGLYILAGPGIEPGWREDGVPIEAMAATVYSTLKVTPPFQLDAQAVGKPLPSGAPSPLPLPDQSENVTEQIVQPYTECEETIIRNRLQELGYLE